MKSAGRPTFEVGAIYDFHFLDTDLICSRDKLKMLLPICIIFKDVLAAVVFETEAFRKFLCSVLVSKVQYSFFGNS